MMASIDRNGRQRGYQRLVRNRGQVPRLAPCPQLCITAFSIDDLSARSGNRWAAPGSILSRRQFRRSAMESADKRDDRSHINR